MGRKLRVCERKISSAKYNVYILRYQNVIKLHLKSDLVFTAFHKRALNTKLDIGTFKAEAFALEVKIILF